MALAAGSITRYCRFFHTKHVASVLDYGAGTLRNALFLAHKGFKVYAADVPAQVDRILQMAGHLSLAGVLDADDLQWSRLDVDLVISTYVLNIIPEGGERSRYLRNVQLNLRPEGFLLVEARCRVEFTDCGEYCSCTHRCPRCEKTYSHQELDLMLAPYGFKRLSHYYCHHAVAVLYQKTGP